MCSHFKLNQFQSFFLLQVIDWRGWSWSVSALQIVYKRSIDISGEIHTLHHNEVVLHSYYCVLHTGEYPHRRLWSWLVVIYLSCHRDQLSTRQTCKSRSFPRELCDSHHMYHQYNIMMMKMPVVDGCYGCYDEEETLPWVSKKSCLSNLFLSGQCR